MDHYLRVVEDVARREAIRIAEAAVCEAWETMLLESRFHSDRLVEGRRLMIGLVEERVRRAGIVGDDHAVATARADLAAARAAANRDELVAAEVHQIVEEELGVLGEAAWARADAAETDAGRLADAAREVEGR